MALRPWPALLAMAHRIDTVSVPYYAFLKCWIAAFGPGTVSVRIPCALASLIALAPFSRATARLAGERAALFATAVLAFAGIDLAFAVIARGYALELCALAFATWALLRLVDGRRGASAILCAGGVAACYAHLVAGAFLAAQVIAFPLLTRDGRVMRRAALAGAAIALGVAPLVAGVLTESAWLDQLDLVAPTNARTVADLPRWVLGGTMGGRLDGPWLPAALAVVAAAGIPAWRRACVPLAWLALSFAIVLVASLAHPLLVFRYLRFELLPVAMLAGIGLDLLSRRTAAVGAVLAVALGTAGMLQAVTTRYYDWRAVAGQVVARARPGDAVVVDAAYGVFPYRAALREAGVAGPPIVFPAGIDETTWRRTLGAAAAKELAVTHRGLWIVVQPRRRPDAMEALVAAFPLRVFTQSGNIRLIELRR